jgi:hypothetical protein
LTVRDRYRISHRVTVGLLAAACLVAVVGLVRRPRLTVCLLAVLSAGHAAGLVPAPAPVRDAQAQIAGWQQTTAARIVCGHLARRAETARQVTAAEAACRRAWRDRERR